MRRQRKMKSSKGKTLSREAVLIIGYEDDGTPVLISGKTVGGNNPAYNKAVGLLYREFKIEKTEAQIGMLSATDREIYNIKPNDDPEKFILIFDETDPKVIEQKENIINMKTMLYLCQFFNMDAKNVINEEGEEINHWQDLRINPKNGLLGVAKYIINTMEIPKDNYKLIGEEIDKMKAGKKTLGDIYLDELEEQEEVLKEIEDNVSE